MLVDRKSPFAILLFALTTLYFFLSIALVRFMVAGLPVRALLGLCLFVLVYVIRPSLLPLALRNCAPTLLVILYAAFLGFMVSLFNDATLEDTLRQLQEIHFQAIICLLTGFGLLHLIGPKYLAYSFIIIVLLSGLVAVLQAVHVDFGWAIRQNLQSYQEYDAETLFLTQRSRAMGLSFSPVHLGTQICLAFAAMYLAYRTNEYDRTIWSAVKIFFWLALMLFIAVVSGNRSPILGFVVFFCMYAFYFRPSIALISLIFLLPFIILAYVVFTENIDTFSGSEVRAIRMGDKSSEGREALRAFGTLLFLDQPLGYGLKFHSLEHVNDYWPQLQSYENAETVWVNAVHNYYLNIILKYGLLFFPIVLYCAYRSLRTISVFLAFLPYAVHIFFHNDGPLQGDFLIWYFLPLISLISEKSSYKEQYSQRLGHTLLTESRDIPNSIPNKESL